MNRYTELQQEECAKCGEQSNTVKYQEDIDRMRVICTRCGYSRSKLPKPINQGSSTDA